MDTIFLAEIIVVGLIIVGQFWVFFRNLGAISRLGKIFPKFNLLEVNEEKQVDLQATEVNEVPQLKDNPRFSREFRDIVHMTNAYLTRNKGASQGERLQEIAERKSDSMEEAIETNLPLPLYIGLLATFTGVIIGLIQIAIDGVSDAAIQSFIGGVVVGMVGSATGLLLTVRSNQSFKAKKEIRDQGMEDYFQFLRTQVFHPEAAPVQGSIKNLRDSLAAFQDGFAQYQGQMNESLSETLKLFKDLKGVFSQIRTIEQGLSGIGKFVNSNDDLIEKQAQYLEAYSKKAEAYTQKLGNSFQQIDKQVDALVAENIRALDESTKAAYVKMDQYLASLDGGDQRAFARSLSADLSRIDEDIKSLQEKSLLVNSQLLERLNQEAASRKVLNTSLSQFNDRISTLENGKGTLMDSPLIQTFVYTGIVAFLIAIGSGAVYLLNTFAG